MSRIPCLHVALLLALVAPAGAFAQASFVNWETPQVHPLDITPDGNTLLAVNTADNRLERFALSSGMAIPAGSIPVGLDPVSVRARSVTEAWVVNQISDSVSIVDLTGGNVVATLRTDDEPADVVFAGSPERAFVSCSQANTVLVFDPADITQPPVRLPIAGEDPRALAVSPDGGTVYAAIFESGNGSTILGGGSTLAGGFFPPNVVSHPAGPYGGVNPPPNNGGQFEPPLNPANPFPPAVGLIVKKLVSGVWLDDNGVDWGNLVSGSLAVLSGRPGGWDLPDRDVAIIDAATLDVGYATGLMNVCMAVGVNPATGRIAVAGTDATNEIRFEPVLRGRFLRVEVALVDAAPPHAAAIVDLNGHLDYDLGTIPQAGRDLSIGDPRGIVWNAAGTRAYISGMGSNNLVVVDAAGARAGLAPTIEVGEGPTGVVLDEARARLYVLNRFEASISAIDTLSELEIGRVFFHDPTPAAIRAGRKHLYDTHKTSGLGQIACASCHVDARTDRLGWDLGDPSGAMRAFNQNCLMGVDPTCQDWHPMKGPMMTQTLQDIIGNEPLHWRGDRDGLEEFNGAFLSLQGDDAGLTPGEMQEYEDFLATIHFPPNPFRNPDNTLPANLPLPGHFTSGRFAPAGQPLPNGNAVNGLNLYRNDSLDALFDCVSCHTLPTGMGSDTVVVGLFNLQPFPVGPNGEHHHALTGLDGSTNVSIKIPQLRNVYEKVGFDATQTENLSGFGFLHDGSVDSLGRFVSEPVFAVASDQEVADLVAFMLAFSGSDLPQGSFSDPLDPPGTASQDTHAAVGRQETVDATNRDDPALIARLQFALGLADAGAIGLVAKGVQGGIQRGYASIGGGMMQSDRQAESITVDALRQAADSGAEITFTVVPAGTETRIGIDRDEDGFLDRDELDACSDPGDPLSFPPGPGCDPSFVRGDCNDSGGINISDPIFLLSVLFGGAGPAACSDACDGNDDGALDVADVVSLLNYLFIGGTAPPEPHPTCGTDPTDDPLDCDAFASCP